MENIFHRVSIRKYEDRVVEKEKIIQILRAPMQDRMDLVHEILNLPADLEVFSLFALGYPAETREQQNRFDKARIHFVE